MSVAVITSPAVIKVLDFTDFCGKQKIRERGSLSAEAMRTWRDSGVKTVLILEAGWFLNGSGAGGSDVKFGVVSDLIGVFDVQQDKPAEEGVRFTDMSDPYDPELRKRIQSALPAGSVQEVCAAGVARPDLLTPAEVKVLAQSGAHAAVAFLHHETRRAREHDLVVAGLIIPTGSAAGGDPRVMAKRVWEAVTGPPATRE